LIGEQPKPTIASIQEGITSGDIVYVAHVHNKSHFVLLTGFDPKEPGAFFVNDPFYNST
jgi:hypothetical protein